LDQILTQLAGSLPAARSIEQLTRPLLDMLGAVTGLESTYLTSIDLEENLQHVRFARNTGAMTIPEGLSVPWSDTLCKRAIDEGRMSTSDVASCWGDSDAARQLGIQTYVSAPIRSDDGMLLGTLCAASANQRTIGTDAESILRLFSNLVGNFIERERLVEHLRDANEQLMSYAMTDPLTGLPNRRALFEDLQRTLSRGVREGTSVLVGLIDLDGFKRINDSYGHQCGDQFLQQMARRLGAGLRASDMLGRLGGDEFVIVGAGPALPAALPAGPVIVGDEPQTAAQVLQSRVAASTVGEFEVGEQRLQYAGASVGVVAVNPMNLDAEAAVRLADAQMYEVKRARKQRAGTATPAAATTAIG
jgi:diguanylate cyclase